MRQSPAGTQKDHRGPEIVENSICISGHRMDLHSGMGPSRRPPNSQQLDPISDLVRDGHRRSGLFQAMQTSNQKYTARSTQGHSYLSDHANSAAREAADVAIDTGLDCSLAAIKHSRTMVLLVDGCIYSRRLLLITHLCCVTHVRPKIEEPCQLLRHFL